MSYPASPRPLRDRVEHPADGRRPGVEGDDQAAGYVLVRKPYAGVQHAVVVRGRRHHLVAQCGRVEVGRVVVGILVVQRRRHDVAASAVAEGRVRSAGRRVHGEHRGAVEGIEPAAAITRPARAPHPLRDGVGSEIACPEQFAGSRVVGEGGAGGVIEIQDAVHHDRRHLRDDVVAFHLDRPCQLQLSDVRGVDLVDGGVAPALQVEVVRRPVELPAATLRAGGCGRDGQQCHNDGCYGGRSNKPDDLHRS